MASYLAILVLFLGPVAADLFVNTFLAGSQAVELVQFAGYSSPFAAVFNLPLVIDGAPPQAPVAISVFWGHLVFSIVYNGCLLLGAMWLFQIRWRVSE